MTAPWAIVPVKGLVQAKQRLAGVLPPEARGRLMLAMLRDVLATLRQVEGLGPVLVVTPDADVADVADEFRVRVLREAEPRGHSAAAMAGLFRAATHGATAAFTLPGDAPLVTPDEVARLVQEAGRSSAGRSVVLVPSHDGDGTNAILAEPPDAFLPSFGPGSFARHREEAAAQGVACRILELPGLSRDIDEPGDLDALMALKRDDRAYAFLQGAFAGASRP